MTARAPSAHLPVLAVPAVDLLINDPAGTYVDATFGRGGHARLILDRLTAHGRLIGLDRDPRAAAASIEDPRFHFVHTRFSRLRETLAELGVQRLHGLLLDLGVSSPQIDEPARGFSWRSDAPLDMRMDTSSGATASQWLASTTYEELRRVIRDYGEERSAAPIAKAIVARRDAGQSVGTTAELAAIVAGAIGGRSRRDAAQHPATRTFQALRIHVNQELEELALVLDQAIPLLATGGRLVVISFHSLEDRIVKQFIETHAHPERSMARLPLRAAQLPPARLRAVARIRPDEAEVAANPRARSAVMRVAQRTAAAWPARSRP